MFSQVYTCRHGTPYPDPRCDGLPQPIQCNPPSNLVQSEVRLLYHSCSDQHATTFKNEWTFSVSTSFFLQVVVYVASDELDGVHKYVALGVAAPTDERYHR